MRAVLAFDKLHTDAATFLIRQDAIQRIEKNNHHHTQRHQTNFSHSQSRHSQHATNTDNNMHRTPSHTPRGHDNTQPMDTIPLTPHSNHGRDGPANILHRGNAADPSQNRFCALSAATTDGTEANNNDANLTRGPKSSN